MARAVGYPDCEYLEEMASVGVRLGTDSEIPRVLAAYKEKSKWNLPDPSFAKITGRLRNTWTR